MHATYSPDDNKLRLYSLARLDPDTYARVKAAGFRWAPRQELFVAPAWTPAREDLLIELCGDIDDEDTTLAERAEERAERFDDFSAARAGDANRAKASVDALANGIPLGQPILVGHHSEKRARKDAERIRNGMGRAVKLWETAQYWERRAEGALRHAKYKELPSVRARRIKGLEADQRKHEKDKRRSEALRALWQKEELTLERAKAIANHHHGRVTLADGTEHWSAWFALDAGKITPEEAKRLCLKACEMSIAWAERWLAHLANRLTYERAMYAEGGGIPADRVKPEKGGAVKCWVDRGRWLEIQKVNRVSVSVKDNWGNGGKDFLRTVPFDKLRAVLSRADYELHKSGQLAVPPEAPRPVYTPPEPTPFDAMKDSLAAGVQVVAAPQLFPTPPDLARRLVELAEIQNGDTILEPSAGTGRLVEAITGSPQLNYHGGLYLVECNRLLCDALEARGWTVHCADFLQWTGGPFHRIIMNPPFGNAEDIKHIEHARGMLREGGRLVAICANGPRQRERLIGQATAWYDLPADSFAEAGTRVNAAIVVIDA